MRGMGHAANAPMRIKLAVKRAEIVAPFYMDTRSRLTQVRYPAPDEARRRSHLGEKSEIRVVRAGCARPHHPEQEKGPFNIYCGRGMPQN